MDLTVQQKRYLNFRLAGYKPLECARMAEYGDPKNAAKRMEQKEEVIEAMKVVEASDRKKALFTREIGIEKLMKGVQIAIDKSDPMGIARCVNELNRMHGFLAPEQKEIIHNIEGLTTLKKLEALSDDQLMKMLGNQGMVVDGEYEIIDENVPKVSESAN